METKSTNRKGLDIFLVLLRTVIGWHFLYEGISKLLSPGWSSYNFLSVSKWIFADFFQSLAANPRALEIVDFLNIWGLILIGLSLFFGILTRYSSAFGIIMLSLYYVANPPFLGMDFGVPAEGQYLIVNKNLIELMALCVFLFIPPKSLPGLDRLISLAINQFKQTKEAGSKETGPKGCGLPHAAIGKQCEFRLRTRSGIGNHEWQVWMRRLPLEVV